MQKKDAAICKMVKTINSCRKPEHITATSKMLELFERIYGKAEQLRGWLLMAEFEVKYYYSKTKPMR